MARRRGWRPLDHERCQSPASCGAHGCTHPGRITPPCTGISSPASARGRPPPPTQSSSVTTAILFSLTGSGWLDGGSQKGRGAAQPAGPVTSPTKAAWACDSPGGIALAASPCRRSHNSRYAGEPAAAKRGGKQGTDLCDGWTPITHHTCYRTRTRYAGGGERDRPSWTPEQHLLLPFSPLRLPTITRSDPPCRQRS